MIRIALVEYFNTRPFLDGLINYFPQGELNLQLLAPSACAQAFSREECELALLPVGALEDLPEATLLGDFCIGANGEVDSVFLFSQVEATEIRRVYLDPHSRSSNGLTRVLMEHHWKTRPHYLNPTQREIQFISGNTGGVLIGDFAFQNRGKFRFEYDLAKEWKAFCGLPFVFAVWAYRKDSISTENLSHIKAALQLGMDQADTSAKKWGAKFGYSDSQALDYLRRAIDYRFDHAKHEALLYYSELLKGLPL